MGADIRVESRSAIVKGVERLSGAEVSASDLRAGAALVIAGLAAKGQTTISGLEYLDRAPALGGIFRQSLAAPGAVGTLEKRFGDLAATAGLRAKTGTLTNVSALSGYLTTQGGEKVVFSILSNGNRGSGSAARAAEERIVGILSRFTRERTPPQGEGPTRMVPR